MSTVFIFFRLVNNVPIILHAEDEQIVNTLRLKIQRGPALGSEGFVKRLENKLNRSLACLNSGRPKIERQ